MFEYKDKMEYTKFPRSNVHCTIREDLYTEFLILSKKIKQPSTKMLDVILEEILSDKIKINEFIQKVKQY